MPERFRDFDKTKKTLLPFGGGKRICVGRNMAMIELQLAMIKLVRAFKFSMKEIVWPIPRTTRFTAGPSPYRLNLEKRK